MNAVEIIALVFVIALLLKLIILAISKKPWMNMVSGLYKRTALLFIVELILAAVVLYYLTQTLSIVTIMACVLFGAFLTGMTFAVYGKELMPAMTKALKKPFLKKAWFPVLIWLALAIWTLVVLF